MTSFSIKDIFLYLAVIICISCYSVECYKIGVGRADCTGPPVEVTFMGYANLKQKGKGLHLRQFARAFVVEDLSGNRVAYVSVDSGMIGYGVKREVIKRLKDRYQEIYTIDNVVISGTHTHSTPGGFLMDLLYDLSILGFVPQTYEALCQGIFLSIKRATDNMQEGRIFLKKTTVLNANINRSPTSYLMNPEVERARYEFDVDKEMTQLKFVNLENQLIGVFHWFAVHPTSMNNTNHLVSSDNVGYASMLLEKHYNPNKLPGKGKFVGAFASTNLGDVSPNIRGPKCQKSGNPCDVLTSRCPHEEGECVASGPGKDMFESTHIIATRLYEAGVGLLQEDSGREVTGDIAFIHQTVNMTNYSASVYNPLSRKMDKIRGCLPAMGYSFAAGTTDGPGVFLFEQGETTSNPMWNALRDFIAPPTQADIDCQHPKPILLATGRAAFPYEWQPKVVPTQILKIGDLLLAGVPGEPTTMSGRRLRNAIRKSAIEAGGAECDVILAGLSNLYSSYIATFEEYQAQRYEAASTLYGPHTLSIYINQFKTLTTAMMNGKSVDKGPEPPYLNDKVLSLVPGVVFDGHPIGKDFGAVKVDAKRSYKINEVASVTFIAGNPRNNIFHEKTYLVVEKKVNERWKVMLTDADWDTKMHWERTSTLLGFSDIRIEWTIGPETVPGEYRIRHFGNYKYILGGIFPYEGVSRTFNVTADIKF